VNLTIALLKSVTMGSRFWGEPLSIETEALGDSIDAGVGWLTVDEDENSF
jgi:hypothetical protein